MKNMSKYPQYAQPDRNHERRLVEQTLTGDQQAFAEIYTTYSPRVFAFCLKRTGDRAEAEDLTQETFVQLYRSLKSFEGRSSLLTWTFGIAHNVCSRHYRYCSRWMVGSRDGQELDERPIQATTERRIDAMRVLRRCDEVLESSRRPAHQEIFHLRYGERLSIRSIAERVGKSKDAVKVSLRRSRSALTNRVPELGAVLDNVAQSA
jgi:RNA polymerase sigma-70 factor (ECF subfamily)